MPSDGPAFDDECPYAHDKQELKVFRSFDRSLRDAQSKEKEKMVKGINAAARIASEMSSTAGIKHVVKRLIALSKDPKAQKETAVYAADSIMRHCSAEGAANDTLAARYERHIAPHLQNFFKRALRQDVLRDKLGERFLVKVLTKWKEKRWFLNELQSIIDLIVKQVPGLKGKAPKTPVILSPVKGGDQTPMINPPAGTYGEDVDLGGETPVATLQARQFGAVSMTGAPATPALMQATRARGILTPNANAQVLTSVPKTPMEQGASPATPMGAFGVAAPMTPGAAFAGAGRPGAAPMTPADALGRPGALPMTPHHLLPRPGAAPMTPAAALMRPGMGVPVPQTPGDAVPQTPAFLGAPRAPGRPAMPSTPGGSSVQPFTPRPVPQTPNMAVPTTPAMPGSRPQGAAQPFTPAVPKGVVGPQTPAAIGATPGAMPFTPAAPKGGVGPQTPASPGAMPFTPAMPTGGVGPSTPASPGAATRGPQPFTPALPSGQRGPVTPGSPRAPGARGPATPASPGAMPFTPASPGGGLGVPQTPARPPLGGVQPQTPAGLLRAPGPRTPAVLAGVPGTPAAMPFTPAGPLPVTPGQIAPRTPGILMPGTPGFVPVPGGNAAPMTPAMPGARRPSADVAETLPTEPGTVPTESAPATLDHSEVPTDGTLKGVAGKDLQRVASEATTEVATEATNPDGEMPASKRRKIVSTAATESVPTATEAGDDLPTEGSRLSKPTIVPTESVPTEVAESEPTVFPTEPTVVTEATVVSEPTVASAPTVLPPGQEEPTRTETTQAPTEVPTQD
eukprot:gnl/TRDRNA2_/TRDRNA2_156992_c0_seq1.p1 gnl/TRDRNA2_/TRDRNA2_156992_c0~~gnl/TRDRNA2_/TRDRNA2_156992_c0_seq1.p1  ORF type:complete len:794 (-),score=124.49 gnl/TRDRNA2_/TRDRNA2_156992_c0_seq1:150-2531(-)